MVYLTDSYGLEGGLFNDSTHDFSHHDMQHGNDNASGVCHYESMLSL